MVGRDDEPPARGESLDEGPEGVIVEPGDRVSRERVETLAWTRQVVDPAVGPVVPEDPSWLCTHELLRLGPWQVTCLRASPP